MREGVCLHCRRPFQYVIGHKWNAGVPNYVATPPSVPRVVTQRVARIGSVRAGQRTAGHESGGHERHAEHGLSCGHGGKRDRPHRRRRQKARRQGSADWDDYGKQGRQRRGLPVRQRRESDAPDHHPGQVSGKTHRGGKKPWRIRYTEARCDCCAERRNRPQPVVVANSESDDCAGGGRSRYKPRPNAHPDS